MQQCMELTNTNRSRAYPIFNSQICFGFSFQATQAWNVYSLIAQLVEHSTVNRVVTGSSPVRGAIWRGVRVWPKEHDWKSCRRHKRLEGSNPSLSATNF